MLTTSRVLVHTCVSIVLTVLIVPVAIGAEAWRVAGEGVLNTPAGVAIHDRSIYVADFDHHRIEVFSLSGERVGGWGGPGSDPGRFNGPSGIAFGPDGRVYITDFYNHRVQVFSRAGRFLGQWGRRGGGVGEFRGPIGIAADRSGAVYVTDLDNHRVQRFTAEGAYLSSWGVKGSKRGQMIDPWGIAIGPSGDIYVADHGNHRIQRFNPAGQPQSWTATAAPNDRGLVGPMALTVGLDGTVYVSDLIADRVLRFDAQGRSSGKWSAVTGSGGLCFGLALGRSALVATNADRDRIERTPLAEFESNAGATTPTHFALSRTWPNPSSGSTLLRFGLPSQGTLRVEIFAVDGRRVRSFGWAEHGVGETVVRWNGSTDAGRPAGPGIYFVRGRFNDGRTEVTTSGRVVLLQ